MAASQHDTIGFDRRMAALGPFETHPHVAVAVSGGADSMALALLAAKWARREGGRVTGFTVDHGLRPESGLEAQQVGRWLKDYGIEHRILVWTGVKPVTGIQAAARAARYRLMNAACRQAGILHLLVAHHQEDQAETFLLRLGRSSGIDGLAAMAAVVERDGLQLLRPLLQVPRKRLRAVLTAAGQRWIEDPSNDNPAYARIRIRQSLPGLATAGVPVSALAETSARMARARVALESAASELLGRSAIVHPAGYITIDGRVLFDAPEEISLRALSRVLMCGGGGKYGPPQLKLENLHEKMKAQVKFINGWKGATLARCRVTAISCSGASKGFLVCREMRNLPTHHAVPVDGKLRWDRRFELAVIDPPGSLDQREKRGDIKGLMIAPLGRNGLLEIRASGSGDLSKAVPKTALWTLPALFDDDGVVQAPLLNYSRCEGRDSSSRYCRAIFYPAHSLSGVGFAIAE